MQLERKDSQLSVRRNRYFGGLKCETAQADLREFKAKSAEEKLASGTPASVLGLQYKRNNLRPDRNWLKRPQSTDTVKNGVDLRPDSAQKPTATPKGAKSGAKTPSSTAYGNNNHPAWSFGGPPRKLEELTLG